MTIPALFQPIQEFNTGSGEADWTELRTVAFSAAVSSDQVQMGLGDESTPDTSTWASPGTDFLLTRPDADTLGVQLFIGGDIDPADGEYWTWLKLTNAPVETLIRLTRIVVHNLP